MVVEYISTLHYSYGPCAPEYTSSQTDDVSYQQLIHRLNITKNQHSATTDHIKFTSFYG